MTINLTTRILFIFINVQNQIKVFTRITKIVFLKTIYIFKCNKVVSEEKIKRVKW